RCDPRGPASGRRRGGVRAPRRVRAPRAARAAARAVAYGRRGDAPSARRDASVVEYRGRGGVVAARPARRSAQVLRLGAVPHPVITAVSRYAAEASSPATASSSSSSFTVSPTITPPLSSTALKLTPKSLRLTAPRTLSPATVFPQGLLAVP